MKNIVELHVAKLSFKGLSTINMQVFAIITTFSE